MVCGASSSLHAQQGGVARQAFEAGAPLGMSPNTRVFGSFHFTESCSYDPARDLYVTPSAGNRTDPTDNDGYVSLVNPDGTVHTLKWIGESRTGLSLHNPLGSDIVGDLLYLVDVNFVRWFDMRTGEPQGSVEVEGAARFNDLAVAEDGSIYLSQTGSPDGSIPERIYRLSPDRRSSVLVDGPPLSRPNGVALDPDGNLVVVNVGSADVHTFAQDGRLLRTEQTLDPVNDGLVILQDGTKYVSSVGSGTIVRIRPGEEPDRVAWGIPSAASICYDPRRNRIVVPMNSGNAIAIVELN